tara:strand:+ start:893 stop:1615 length:723 start_codon:yes stop_codon:yes gene_type:complete
MKRTVILSTNDVEDYKACLPYVQQAWNKLGWHTLTFYLGNDDIKSTDRNLIINIDPIENVRDATVVQVSRLFAHKYIDGMIMTSDVDMMPLTDYWSPEEDTFTCYGRDLTEHHYPICYIAAKKELWDELIPEESIKEILEKFNQYKSETFDKWWYVDQDIVTSRLKELKELKIKEIKRGKQLYQYKRDGMIFSHENALGRIDRNCWLPTKNHGHTPKIDSHLPRPFDKNTVESLLTEFLK